MAVFAAKFRAHKTDVFYVNVTRARQTLPKIADAYFASVARRIDNASEMLFTVMDAEISPAPCNAQIR